MWRRHGDIYALIILESLVQTLVHTCTSPFPIIYKALFDDLSVQMVERTGFKSWCSTFLFLFAWSVRVSQVFAALRSLMHSCTIGSVVSGLEGCVSGLQGCVSGLEGRVSRLEGCAIRPGCNIGTAYKLYVKWY